VSKAKKGAKAAPKPSPAETPFAQKFALLLFDSFAETIPGAQNYDRMLRKRPEVDRQAFFVKDTAVRDAFVREGSRDPEVDGRRWVGTFLAAGARALLETAAVLDTTPDLPARAKGNTLSFMVDELSTALRKHVLESTLRATNWNLTHTAERLRLGDASAVIREIKRADLSEEYRAAKKSGAVAPGGHKIRAPDKP
jgi:hypothetical protein